MKLVMISAAAVAMLAVTGGVAGAADGKEVYTKSCAGCHTALNPKLGDKKAWAPLVKKGAAALTASVVKGKGAMPPKGGASSLSEADIKAAVEYIISQAK